MLKIFYTLLACLLLDPILIFAENQNPLFTDGLRFSTAIGGSKSIPNTLVIHRADHQDYFIDATYDSKPFDDSQYWSGRLEWWKNKSAWEIELIHHKIYLQNYPQGLVDFSVSDGYNLIYINKAWALPYNNVVFRSGLGLVVAHPDITFTDRNRYIVKGWQGLRVAGPSMQIGLEQRFPINDRYYLKSELKFTASYAKTAISNDLKEYVIAPDLAFHILLGIGSNPVKKESIKERTLFLVPGFFPLTTGLLLGLK